MMPRTKGVESLWCASCASLSRACGCVAGREGPWNGTRSPTGGAESRDRSTFDDGAQLRMTALAWKARSGAHNSDQLSNDRYRIRLSNRSNPTLVPCDHLRERFLLYRMFIVCFICQSLQPPLANRRSEPEAERMKSRWSLRSHWTVGVQCGLGRGPHS